MVTEDMSHVLLPKMQSPEKAKGISRKKKSASQTEVLERAYLLEKYPSETTRSVLSRELNLTEKQLQIWFTHRRYKDRRDGIEDEKLMANCRRSKHETQVEHRGSFKKGERIDLNSREDDDSEDGYPAQVLAEEHYDEDLITPHRIGVDIGNGRHEVFVEPKPKPAPKRSGPRIPTDLSMPPRKLKMNAQARAELATIFAVENQLGGPLRIDGPPLGFEFDPLPPDAFQQLAMTEAPFASGESKGGESENSERLGIESNSKRIQDFAQVEEKKKFGLLQN